MEAGNNSKIEKGKAPRHSPYQIQELEAFFKDCRNPNESQRKQLSRELGLGQDQIMFWFQNRRNQTKVQNDRMDNAALRSENKRLKSENLAFSEILKNAICPRCDGRPSVREEEKKFNIQKLQIENSQMRKEYERIANEITSKTGKPISHLLSLPPESLDHLLSLPAKSFRGQERGCSSSHGIDLKNSDNPLAANIPIEITENDKIMMIRNAGCSFNELTKLLMVFEPLWVMSPTYGGYVLNNDGNYSKIFPKLRHLSLKSSRIESSTDWATVPIAASDLVEMFLDARKWADLFPTTVMEAKIIETLDTGSLAGSLNLMYVRTHILSSLVAPREFVFLRYGVRQGPGTWFIVDESYDCLSEIQEPNRTLAWRFPSGLRIESLSNVESKVTWVDHVEVDVSMNHPLYRNLLSSVYGYGSKRWISTLKRMIERSLYSMRPESTSSHEHGEGIISLEGKRNIMALSHRMVRDFCAVVSIPKRSELLECAYDKVRMYSYENYEPGQPHDMIVAVSTSLWLPLTYENLFNFLRDEDRRLEWDVMLNQVPVNRITSMSTGARPGNCVSIMQHQFFNNQMVLLQENSIDPLGALVVFATVDTQHFKSVIHGDDSSKIPILPCGFLISGDGTPFGSLLTLTFQWEVAAGNSVATKMAADKLSGILSHIIQKIKVALGCSELV